MRTPKYVKDKLVDHAYDVMATKRCELVRRLIEEMRNHPDNIVIWERDKEITGEISKLNQSISEMRMKINELEKEQRKYVIQQRTIEDKWLLSDVSKRLPRSCAVKNIHPEILKYDMYAEEVAIHILEADTITLEQVDGMCNR